MYKSNINITTILLYFLLLFPKITLIPIDNYWQGLRTENLISLMILFYFFFNNINFIFYFNQKKKINLEIFLLLKNLYIFSFKKFILLLFILYYGAYSQNRTGHLFLTMEVLYHLSYVGILILKFLIYSCFKINI